MPNFFIYAKDKAESQVEPINNSTMNRISDKIEPSRLKFSKTIGSLDYLMLMNHSRDCMMMVSQDDIAVRRYDYWLRHQYLFNLEADKGVKQEDMYVYRKIRAAIIEETGLDADDVANRLVKFLYVNRKSSQKKMLWACFGEEIVNNLKNNTAQLGNICPICGRRFYPKRANQAVCSAECANVIKH